MKKILAVALLSTLIAPPALAGDSNVYLFGELGSAAYQNVGDFPNPGKIGLGAGYRFDKNLAAELGYTIFGNSTIPGAASGTLKAHSFHPALVANLPINQQFSVFGKLGFASNHAESTNTLGTTATVSQTSLYYGLGVQFDINQQFSVRGQYENFGKFEDATDPMSASAVTVGVIFKL